MFALPLLLLSALQPSSPVNPVTPALAKLNGDWIVDLRPTSAAPAHPMPMHLEIGTDGSVKGFFYASQIDTGLASDNKGRQCFAFTTADRSGPYHTSGCLREDGSLEGQTWSEGRHFLLTWQAVTGKIEAKPLGQ